MSGTPQRVAPTCASLGRGKFQTHHLTPNMQRRKTSQKRTYKGDAPAEPFVYRPAILGGPSNVETVKKLGCARKRGNVGQNQGSRKPWKSNHLQRGCPGNQSLLTPPATIDQTAGIEVAETHLYPPNRSSGASTKTRPDASSPHLATLAFFA